MHRFFHTVVILGAGVTSGCAENHKNMPSDAGSDGSNVQDASKDAQSLADRVIADAEQMREASAKDAEVDAGCYGNSRDWDQDACPLIR